MSDPFYLADILLGRVGVLRSTAESIVLELCEAQTKLDAQTNAGSNGDAGVDPGGVVALGNSEDALRLAIKNKLERVQTNLKLLRKLVPEFGSNLMLEYHWKNQVQEMGTKAQNVYMDQLCGAFPRMEMLGDVRCPPAPNAFFVPKSHKRGRVFDPFGEKQPATLNEMMDYMMAKNRKLKFFKHAETTRGGRRVIKSIKCEINKEVTVHISFCPPVPESGPNGETGVAASPMTPSTPTSPAFGGSRLRSTRNKNKKQQQQLVKKKKGDMLTKAKLAAEEATKMEMEELKQRITESREASKEQELARAACLQVTKYIQRISIFPYNEQAPLGAWSESSHQLFRLITLHSRKATDHFRKQYPDTCFYHLFTWLGYYDKIYQTPCSLCKKVLIKESEDWSFLPPSFRDYGSGQAFHSKCLPVG
ncbi:Mediator of RNA polymerase ii transcription subunit, partial [Globisporangium splendens]